MLKSYDISVSGMKSQIQRKSPPMEECVQTLDRCRILDGGGKLKAMVTPDISNLSALDCARFTLASPL